jgi:hypothetical protein
MQRPFPGLPHGVAHQDLGGFHLMIKLYQLSFYVICQAMRLSL